MVSSLLSSSVPQLEISSQQVEVLSVKEPLSETVDLTLMRVPGGEFLMGSPEEESDRQECEGPQHLVRVPGFWMGQFLVTQEQWSIVAQFDQINRELDPSPSKFDGGRLPVDSVSWYAAQEFCDRLSASTMRNYRLPTEAEWEYACRAGTTTAFHFGGTITTDLANYRGVNTDYGSGSYDGGPQGKYREQTTLVDNFEFANLFGLCDMHGNLWEWCQDYWHSNYVDAPTDGTAWVVGGDASYRMLRGGSWISGPRDCRSASRFHDFPVSTFAKIGFRIVLAPR